MVSLGAVPHVTEQVRGPRLVKRPSVWRLTLCGIVLLLSGCRSDLAPADRSAGKALRQVGARLELDDSGNVTAVILSNTPTDDESLRHLAGLHSLRSLQLENTGITDAALQYVRDLDNLEQLRLDGTHVTSTGVEHLRGLTSLRTLGLNATEVNDYCLRHLSTLTRLEYLWLDGSPISDQCIPSLTRLEQLRGVGLRDTGVTKTGAAALRRALPNTTVYY